MPMGKLIRIRKKKKKDAKRLFKYCLKLESYQELKQKT